MYTPDTPKIKKMEFKLNKIGLCKWYIKYKGDVNELKIHTQRQISA